MIDPVWLRPHHLTSPGAVEVCAPRLNDKHVERALPVLAVGDGALGFWGALSEVFPETREQRCWFDKIGNVLSALPKSAHTRREEGPAETWNAEDRDVARRAVAAFKLAYGAKFAKAVTKITDDVDELLRFYEPDEAAWAG